MIITLEHAYRAAVADYVEAHVAWVTARRAFCCGEMDISTLLRISTSHGRALRDMERAERIWNETLSQNASHENVLCDDR